MSQPQPGAAEVAPLLIELARAVRAQQFLEDGHPTLRHALAKAAAIWSAGLAEVGTLDLEVTERGFAIGGTVPLEGPGLDELARTLHQHRVLGLQVHPKLEAEELRRLAEGLARPPAQHEAEGGLARALAGAGVRHLALWPMPEPAQPSGRVAGERQVPAPEPPRDSDPTVELVRALADLEPCDELPAYKETADRVSTLLEQLLGADNSVDAYRAALVYGRHVGDSVARSPEIRAAARERLKALFRNETMLALLLERAYARQGSTGVQAIQLLTCLAPDSATHLLDHYASGAAERRRHTIRILVAMGPHAVPAIVNELGSDSTVRVRRAVRVLGDMQNPSAVQLLADRIDHSETAVRREVARSLARIGNQRAIQVLGDALTAAPDVALFAAAGLGTVHDAEAVRVLLEAAQAGKRQPVEVRREVIRNLGRIGDPAALPVLQEILGQKAWIGRKKSCELRIAAAEAIGKIGGSEAVAALEAQTRGGDLGIRQACSEILRQLERSDEDQPLP